MSNKAFETAINPNKPVVGYSMQPTAAGTAGTVVGTAAGTAGRRLPRPMH